MDSLFARLTAIVLSLFLAVFASVEKRLIIDTDIFSDVDDAGALLLASTLPRTCLIAVHVNVASSYSALAVSAILGHYGHGSVPIGLRRPINNNHFFDSQGFELGEYASKVAYHWQGGSLRWNAVEEASEPVELYRKVLAAEDDGAVTIVSIGFLENLSALLNSTADNLSPLPGPELIKAKVAKLVVMGGEYPSGYEFNFWGDNPLHTAHVVNNWPGKITFSGLKMGKNVVSGAKLTVEGPANDPVRKAYEWYRFGEVFQYVNSYGYNHVFPNGSNTWVFDEGHTDQHWLELRVDDATAGRILDELYLKGAWSAVSGGMTGMEKAEPGELEAVLRR
ncbi:hypothetical protein H2199_007410 [Coniosporium tulheliwenetii]|uniref:Uncharacterized protein n=1 Tax=Coniosporium tulheliwenetii TaxID=3383036 RepID=A0ACC2YP83_9PEZI|nr:hypothetical protein H2199_007410 [Cladosporium sp. JES 115]